MTVKNVVKIRQALKTKFDVVGGMTTIQKALQQMQYTEIKFLIKNKRDE